MRVEPALLLYIILGWVTDDVLVCVGCYCVVSLLYQEINIIRKCMFILPLPTTLSIYDYYYMYLTNRINLSYLK